MLPKHNDDEITITETPRILEICGSGCIIREPDLSNIRYMAHRLEIRDITIGTLGWIPEWVLEVHLENCQILPNSTLPGDKLEKSITNLPQSVIQLTCRGCTIPEAVYYQLAHHRLIRLELINQGLSKLPLGINEYAPNLIFLNMTGNQLSQASFWPPKIRGLRLSGNKLSDLAYLGQLPPYLEDLDLSNNRFSEIPVRELSPFLRKLNMSRNELHWLPDDSSEYPPNLRDLNISGNCGLDDLTDAVLPDMLTTLNAAECEIARLPHEWHCYCLTHMDLSDNNITNLDELPFDKVMNINYVGNPCWVASNDSSPIADAVRFPDQSPSSVDGFIDENILSINYADYQSSGANSVFSSGCPTPEKNKDDDYGMAEYKAAISRSSSQEELTKINQYKIGQSSACAHTPTCAHAHTNTNNNSNSLPYPENDPIIKAIDYVMSSGFRRVGSFLTVMSDILTPDGTQGDQQDNILESVYASPSNQTNSIAGQALDELEHYGIFGTFD